MNEDQLNMDIRRFLKTFGVSAQREIEKAVRAAIESGQLQGSETLKATATLEIEGLDVTLVIEEPLHLG